MNADLVLLLLVLVSLGKGAKRVKLSTAELRGLAISAGFVGDAVNIAAAVAKAESGGDPGAEGDLSLGVSRGLWQINLKAHPEFDPVRLFETQYNAHAAFVVSKGGSNWSPWTTFRTGAYKQFMPTPPDGSPAT